MKCTICGNPDIEEHHYIYDPTGTKDDKTHSVKCEECGYTSTEDHHFSGGSCTECGTQEVVKDITVNFTPKSSYKDGTVITIDQNVQILFTKGSQESEFSNTGVKVRQQEKIKFTAPTGKFIKKIEITVSSAASTNTFTADVGNCSSSNVWTGKENSVTLTKDNGKQAVITKIAITFGS